MVDNNSNLEHNMEVGGGGFGHAGPSGGVCPPADTEGAERGSLRSDETGYRPGKPICWYGAECRKLRDPAHCEKYDHNMRPCKFGVRCRRQGRGCRYDHPAKGAGKSPLLKGASNNNAGGQRNDRGNSNSNSNHVAGDEPDPARPVPFVFFLICICALGLVIVPILGECDADIHSKIFFFGSLLTIPFIIFEVLLYTQRSWVLQKFLEGDYSEKATSRKLGLLWYPETVQLLRFTTGDLAGNNIEQYATWETNDVQQQYEAAVGNRDGGQVRRGSSSQNNNSRGGFEFDFPDAFEGEGVTLDASGNLRGLGRTRARFDGSNIVSGDSAWAKAGYWRRDLVTKVLLLLFVVGVECAFVSTMMPPGVAGLGGLAGHMRMPLNTVFVVDGSASIQPEMWQAQQQAGEAFIRAFEKTYGDHGDLNVGIVQFSTEAKIEAPLTSDIPSVLTKFQGLQQMEALTYFDKGLSLCSDNLQKYDAEHKSFDVCVLITDGIDMSELKPEALQALLPTDAAIFGIFVGADDGGINLLKDITECGLAKSENRKCDFFASASDYKRLSAKADEVAHEVVRGVDMAQCAEVSALIGLPVALGMCLPYILWYASCTGLTMWRRRESDNYRSIKGNNNFLNTNTNSN